MLIAVPRATHDHRFTSSHRHSRDDGRCDSAVNWANLLTFLATAITTGISWYVSIRQTRREQDRLDREEARQQRLEDLMQS